MDKENFGITRVIQQQIACIDYDLHALKNAQIDFAILTYPVITHRGKEEADRIRVDFKSAMDKAWGDFVNHQLKLLAEDRAKLEAKFAEL